MGLLYFFRLLKSLPYSELHSATRATIYNLLYIVVYKKLCYIIHARKVKLLLALNLDKNMTEEVKVSSVKKLPIAVCFVVGILVGAGAFYAWNMYMVKDPTKAAAQLEQAQAEAQMKELVDKVGKLIVLPKGEEPVVATINDAAALARDQVFYKGSQNGDMVLVYQKAAKAIVYSPSRDIIINVGPIFLQDQQAQTPAKLSTEETPVKK